MQRTGKKLLFTQVGYPSCAHCGEKSALRKYKKVDEQCQAAAYEGILQALLRSPLVAGLYFWNWLPCVSAAAPNCAIGSSDNSETPQQKLAEMVVKKHFGGNSSINVAKTRKDQD
eukprot:SAG31_NODE_2097_length_6453_cov_16.072867_8_plen_115_part_00